MTSRFQLDQTISLHNRHQHHPTSDSGNYKNSDDDNTYVRTVTKLVAFNNAAVDQFENGCHELAWALFKGALEVKLVIERANSISSSGSNNSSTGTNKSTSSSTSPNHQQPQEIPIERSNPSTVAIDDSLFQRNRYIAKADSILLEQQRLQNEQQPHEQHSRSRNFAAHSTGQPSTITDTHPLVVAPHSPSTNSKPRSLHCSIMFNLYICARPFRLQMEDETYGDDSIKANYTSAIIIFNLAVVEHIVNTGSSKVASLYELASSLLVGLPVDLLGIAIINNVGVWCYENDDTDTAQKCMEHLWNIFRTGCPNTINTIDDSNPKPSTTRNTRVSALDPHERSGILKNITYIVSPPGSASAAA